MESGFIRGKHRHLTLSSAGLVLMVAASSANAGIADLADVPLANATTLTVLPNIMLSFDNSGSMAFDHMPDYVTKSISGSFNWCRGTDGSNTLRVCEHGDPPYFANAFNGTYYNPAFRYKPPVNADGTSKTSYGSPWTSVPSDGYGIQKIDKSGAANPCTAGGFLSPWSVGDECPTYAANATVNLVNEYPERVWCKAATDSPPSENCKSALDGSNNYVYPNGTYKYLKVLNGAPYYYSVNVEWCKSVDKTTNGVNKNYGVAGTCQAKRDSTYKYVRFYGWTRVDIKAGVTYAKAPGRTDCAGASCTYEEEMTNFANWFAWYRTRMQMAKTSIGLAFKDVRGTPKSGAALLADPADPDYLHARIGFTTINNPVVNNIANFDSSIKESFYTALYALNPNGGTPLRKALNELGKMYQGTSTTFADPVQYSCQKNYAILTTDGYWNDNFSSIGDVDGAADRPSLDASKTANTLADVAYHYYHTDLRPGSCTKCTDNVPASGTDENVDDVAQHQHMTTFTVGMGVDGRLTYKDDYKSSKSGDYFNILQGPANWPIPTADSPETIDDLWHAAVNGRGTYLSAKNPNALEEGLNKALRSIKSDDGSGAAAATSNLQPTTGDSAIYVATYRTVHWDGEVSAYTVDLGTGVISDTATWRAANLLKEKVVSTGDGDTRTIYTSNGTVRTLFKSGEGGLTDAQLAYFDNTKLSQYADWSAAQKAEATAGLLVNYLRGHDRYEMQTDSYGTSHPRLYRDRERILGDIVHSQPIYVKAPPHSFSDEGYAAFKADKADRPATLYVAANDGMLHAFDATSNSATAGKERWAYVPPLVLPELWRIADKDYSNEHRFFLDGPLVVTDAKIGGAWKTILLGAMGKGGRGYYALDVTDPLDPKPLWTFSAENNPNVGYSYGTPHVTKLADGTWVAVLTSGYNNVPEGSKYTDADGKGYVFIINMENGNVTTISTDVGTAGNPSGLARLNVQTSNFSVDNTVVAAYGGDLFGNLWKFDLDARTATRLVNFGPTKPIMVAPEIGDIEGRKVIYFGTGRYLGKEDLDDTSVQAIYGIKDDGVTTVTGVSQLVKQTVSGTPPKRSISRNSVDWSSNSVFGWYVELPDTGERVTIDPQLYFGTLTIATTVPTASECQEGGYSWLYQIDYKTGGNIANLSTAATRLTSPIVGMTVAKLPTGTPVIYPITADGKKPSPIILQIAPPTSAGGVKRVLWRELFDQ